MVACSISSPFLYLIVTEAESDAGADAGALLHAHIPICAYVRACVRGTNEGSIFNVTISNHRHKSMYDELRRQECVPEDN